jgi:FkbM family methyltransferase
LTLAKKIKFVAKKLLALSPIALTKNERYDRLTKKVIQKTCSSNSVCIDIGAHEGKILKWMIAQSPLAIHYAFEPIPELFNLLVEEFRNNTHLFSIAVSNTKGITHFNLVQSNLAMSGLQKRSYGKNEIDYNIEVETDCLDHIIPITEKVSLIKMDVEGAELQVIKGAIKTIEGSKPLILFECGKVGGEAYEFSAKDAFQLFEMELAYQIFLIPDWLNNKSPLAFQDFDHYYENGTEYFFLAAPNK